MIILQTITPDTAINLTITQVITIVVGTASLLSIWFKLNNKIKEIERLNLDREKDQNYYQLHSNEKIEEIKSQFAQSLSIVETNSKHFYSELMKGVAELQKTVEVQQKLLASIDKKLAVIESKNN